MVIKIGNKEYKVKEAKTLEELLKGLKGVKELPDNEGMLFYIPDGLSLCVFTMEGMEIPLDIIFINLDYEVVDVAEDCKQGDPDIVSTTENMDIDDVISYVLEVNINSGIKVGDELDIDEEGPVMKVLALDGSSLMDLFGGERIVSRRETKVLIRKSKKADLSKDDKDYKALGRYIFKVIKGLDERSPEYVKSPQ